MFTLLKEGMGADLIFDNTFQKLPGHLFETVKPTPIQNPRLAIWNSELATSLGLPASPNDEISLWLRGETRIAGDQQISTRYAGHQFGVWAGQLGDGRAISLGELLTPSGRQEIQTKGSGLTPFSRQGDGKAVIRSSVREFFGSEAMHGLNIPTSRALALYTGTDAVERETLERSAILARVFPTNLRFGHFEYCYHFKRRDELQALIAYTLETFYPGKDPLQMLETIVRDSAYLLAKWMSIGFCHGVMNTDNMSTLGLTIDYGPFGFLDDFDWNHICNHSDHRGRYSFQNQPQIMFWNLHRFVQCFADQFDTNTLETTLGTYGPLFQTHWNELLASKMGLDEFDPDLTKELFNYLADEKIDYTYFFRRLCHFESDPNVFAPIPISEPLKKWLEKYKLKRNIKRMPSMLKINPKFIFRNWIADKIIQEVENDHFENLNQYLKIFHSPFLEHADFESLSLPPQAHQKNFVLSCSS